MTTEQFELCDKTIIEKSPSKNNIIIVHDDFHHTLIGILTSWIAEKYNKSATAISLNGTGSYRIVHG